MENQSHGITLGNRSDCSKADGHVRLLALIADLESAKVKAEEWLALHGENCTCAYCDSTNNGNLRLGGNAEHGVRFVADSLERLIPPLESITLVGGNVSDRGAWLRKSNKTYQRLLARWNLPGIVTLRGMMAALEEVQRLADKFNADHPDECGCDLCTDIGTDIDADERRQEVEWIGRTAFKLADGFKSELGMDPEVWGRDIIDGVEKAKAEGKLDELANDLEASYRADESVVRAG